MKDMTWISAEGYDDVMMEDAEVLETSTTSDSSDFLDVKMEETTRKDGDEVGEELQVAGVNASVPDVYVEAGGNIMDGSVTHSEDVHGLGKASFNVGSVHADAGKATNSAAAVESQLERQPMFDDVASDNPTKEKDDLEAADNKPQPLLIETNKDGASDSQAQVGTTVTVDDDMGAIVCGKPSVVVDNVQGEKEDGEDRMSVNSRDHDDDDQYSFDSMECDEEDLLADPITTPTYVSKKFDMELLRSCIDDSGPVLEKLQNKDVVLVVGKTGVGKSTFVQAIAGKKIVAVTHQSSFQGRTASTEVFDAVDPSPDFEIGHDKASKTRSINCLVRHGAGKNQEDIVYIDSPGWEDTGGVEVDIATSVTISQVVQKARSLRLAVLINYTSLLEDRGGAVRDVLKLARTFVSDFEKDQRSFMFLFTHTNEVLADPSASLDVAKSCVEREILRIRQGTSIDDSDIQAVLKFIHKSLIKNYPFVDVLHPVKTDFNKIAHFIETELRPVRSLAPMANYGFSGKSQLHLDGQISQLLYAIRRLIRQSASNINLDATVEELKEVRRSLEYFHCHINTHNVRAAFTECEKLCQEHISKQRLVIDEELNKAVNGREYFGSGNVRNLKTLLAQVEALSQPGQNDLSISQYYMNSMFREAFDASCKRVTSDPALENLEQSLKELGKLKSWSDGFSCFEDPYHKICRGLQQQINSIGADISRMDMCGFATLNEERIHSHARKIVALSMVDQMKKEFSLHGIDTKKCLQSLFTSMQKLCGVSRQWGTTPDNFKSKQTNCGQKAWEDNLSSHLLQTAERAKKLEKWHEEACPYLQSGRHRKVVQTIEKSLADMESLATELYGLLCDHFLANRRVSNYKMEQKFKVLDKVYSSYNQLSKPRWEQVLQLYKRVLESLKTDIAIKSKDLEEAADRCRERGLSDGQNDSKVLCAVRSYVWFDQYPTANCPSMQDCFDKACLVYCARMEKIYDRAKNTSSNLQILSKENVEHLRACHDVFAEIKQFDAVARVVDASPDLVGKRTDAFEELKKYFSDMDDETPQLCSNWLDALKGSDLEEAKAITEKLDHLLSEIETIQSFSCLQKLKGHAQSAQTEIMKATKTASSSVEAEFKKPGRYGRKAEILSYISAIGGFPRTDKYLPNISDYKEKARDVVNDAAFKLEKLITDSADGDSIDKAWKAFQKATALDPYTGCEATNRLRPLQSLRENKSEEKDLMVQDMIAREDFAGMGKFLKPMDKSSDVVIKQKCEQYLRDIRELLKKRVSATRTKIQLQLSPEDVEYIATSLNVLVTANKEIGILVKSIEMEVDKPSPSPKGKSNRKWLTSEISSLKEDLGGRFDSMLVAVLDAKKHDDFFVMGKNMHQASLLYDKAGSFLEWKQKTKFREVHSGWDSTKKLVPDIVKTFVESSFEKKCQQLERVMSSLGHASNSQNPPLPDLQELLSATTMDLGRKVRTRLARVREQVEETGSYDDGIFVLENLNKAEELGLGQFFGSFPFDRESVLSQWNDEQAKLYGLETADKSPEEILREYKKLMDKLKKATTLERYLFRTERTYNNLKAKMRRWLLREFDRGIAAIDKVDIPLLCSSVSILNLMARELVDHVPISTKKRNEVADKIAAKFIEECEKAVQPLQSGNLISFEGTFIDIRNLVINFPFVLDHREAMKGFSLVNQLAHDALKGGITKLHDAISNHDFLEVRALVKHNRTHGAFLADHYSLLFEELKQRGRCEKDEWLGRIWDISCESFSCGRDSKNIRSFAILGIIPSATEDDIRKAYKQKARQVHPDKNDGNHDDPGEDFRKVKDARDHLLAAFQFRSESDTEQLCDSSLRDIPSDMEQYVRDCMKNQQYDCLKKLFEKLPDFERICNLVNPEMDFERTKDDIYQLVKEHVRGMRTQVDSSWNERNYKLLNQSITDLKQMEKHLKSLPEIFPESWNQGIIETVRDEIKSLGASAKSFLLDKSAAAHHVDDFRRCFIDMGAVLVELQLFNDFTKEVMNSVLESCLQSDWGYSYLFEFGLSLHNDTSGNGDEVRIAQTILSEFSHFKEVMTMVWNEETAQKPVEDTVKDVTGEKRKSKGGPPEALDIDKDILLHSFYSFESEYKNILAEYLSSDSDKGRLARKTIKLAKSLQPLTCDNGWNDNAKDQLPKILAGVFGLFTIAKSGESFNRIQETSTAQDIGEKILMKPHNIQVLTLLYLLGCGKVSTTSLESQLMQIRTGEGKSMVLGAAAAVLGLLGFKVRCVCYSEYLSNRDYSLFEPVFRKLGLDGMVTYSKITTLSEDTTQAKGDLRGLTQSLLQQNLVKPCKLISQQHPRKKAKNDNGLPSITSSEQSETTQLAEASGQIGTASSSLTDIGSKSNGVSPGTIGSALTAPEPNNSTVAVSQPNATAPAVATAMPPPLQGEEILLVDEVDVFFGQGFYGQTYKQVTEANRPEIAQILTAIFDHYQQNGQKQKLSDIQKTTAYQHLVNNMPRFQFLIDNEIRLMLDHVQKVDDEPYFLDPDRDQIGYKVLDTISYQVTYGYRTIFAYLKEASNGNLKDKTATLNRVLVMPVSCGQFSYARISPARILGVSGTLSSMGTHEKNVLMQYGVENYVFVPSVYGQSNFVFDKAGDGIYIESDESGYFQRICEEILNRIRKKRSVIVFFKDNQVLDKFQSSSFFPKLGRQRAVLREDMDPSEKEFVINKAATAGQITLCPAVFGRGTDFFCKDDTVQQGGGVHIIQTFLSAETSEEVQIQGRTSRQGKKGSYQLVLFEKDLCDDFGVAVGEKDNVPRDKRHEWLCKVREQQQDKYWKTVEDNLKVATMRDEATHKYFDSLLDGKQAEGIKLFEDLYWMIKKPPVPESITIDIAFLIDITGSMAPYCKHTVSTIQGLVDGGNSILSKLAPAFPDTILKLRAGVLGYRDLDDGGDQFNDGLWDGGEHFTESMTDLMSFVNQVTYQPSGGNDLAEDHLGAIHHCMSWGGASDWSSSIKMVMLFTDSPAHGFVPPASSSVPNVDGYAVRHPKGLTASSVSGELVSNGVNLIICSYNPAATMVTEEKLSEEYLKHPQNSKQREVARISMVPQGPGNAGKAGQSLIGDHPRHIVFVLDESGSMRGNWPGVIRSYREYISTRRQNQNESDLVSVVQFDNTAQITLQNEPIGSASRDLSYRGGGTQFAPAASAAVPLVKSTPSSHMPTVVFMSDGGTNDSAQAASTFAALNQQVHAKHGDDLELHVIAFGGGADTKQLQQIAASSPIGRVHLSSDIAALTKVFVSIAGGQDVAAALQGEIAKEISEAVTDTLCLEYLS